MKSRTFDPSAAFAISITLLILFGMLFGWGTHAQTEPPITTIDATDAGTTNGQGTWATAINAAGVIGGYFLDSNFGCHAFVRKPDGTFTSFDGPTGCPIPASINQRSVVTGTYADRSFGCSAGQPDNPPGCGGFHAFTRNPDGTFVSFDPPNVNPHNFIGANSVNAEGAIVGTFADRNTGVFHGFLRARDGTFIIIDGPDVNQGAGGSTGATAINSRGEILGGFSTTNAGPHHSYLRSPDGAFTVFDFPGACDSCTQSMGLNGRGTVVGMYFTPTSGGFFAIRGFLRKADGAFTSFDLPEGHQFASLSPAINSSNAVVGTYFDTNGVAHGFLRPGGHD